MLKRIEPVNTQDSAQRQPRPKPIENHQMVDTCNASDALARAYALILSWPTAEKPACVSTGGKVE